MNEQSFKLRDLFTLLGTLIVALATLYGVYINKEDSKEKHSYQVKCKDFYFVPKNKEDCKKYSEDIELSSHAEFLMSNYYSASYEERIIVREDINSLMQDNPDINWEPTIRRINNLEN